MITDEVMDSWARRFIQLGEKALLSWTQRKDRELLHLQELVDIRQKELEIREEEYRKALLWRQEEHDLYMVAERTALALAKSKMGETEEKSE